VDSAGQTARFNIYQMDISIPPGDGPLRIGGRAFVRYRHADQPLIVQLYRRLRQLFLSSLAV
jgi:hypothetical protein